MAEIGAAYVSILPSFKGFDNRLTGELKRTTAVAGRKTGLSFGTAIAAGASAGLVGAAAGAAIGLIASAGNFVKGSISEAREAQKVGAQTNAVLKSTGSIAGVSAKHVGNLANAISRKTGIDDEQIQSGANLLLTFKNVRNEVGRGNKIFDRATRAAVDLSKAGFGDLTGTSKQLGKALNDPVKGITALGRAGVTFTDKQKDQIKALVKSGDTLKAQKKILKEVESQVGGSAKAQATAGDKLKVSFDNFKEAVGTALLPVLDKLFTKLTPIFQTLTAKVGPAFKKVGGFVKEFTSGFLKGAGGMDGLKQSANDLKPVLSLVGRVIKVLAEALIKAAPHIGQTFRIATKVIGVMGRAFIGAYNASLPFLRGTLRGMGAILRATGRVIQGIGVLSHNKGMQNFGKSMVTAGQHASDLANHIKRIPNPKLKASLDDKKARAQGAALKRYLDDLAKTRYVHYQVINPSTNKPRVSTGGGQTGRVATSSTSAGRSALPDKVTLVDASGALLGVMDVVAENKAFDVYAAVSG